MRPMPELEVHEMAVADLVPYANNAKKHPKEQIDQIAASISEFGNCDPIAVWHNEDGEAEIVEGHGRVMALKQLGIGTAPVICLDHLTDEQRRIYTHAHNQTTMSSGFDDFILTEELANLNADWSALGFSDYLPNFDNLGEMVDKSDEEYQEFEDKFKPKATTDDCFTPSYIYETVKDWACEKFGIEPEKCVRPFYPGGDYENFNYPDGCTVLDNPPFSIMARIIDFYEERGIPYFLFGPQLTLFSGNRPCNYICCGAAIEYENGAKVNTGFVTSYGEWKIDTAPELWEEIDKAQCEAKNENKNEPMNSWQLPDNVITAAMMGKLGHRGISLCIPPGACEFVRKLDNQKPGAALYGGGFLLSMSAAADKAAADKAAAEHVELSARELEIIESLEYGN